MNELDENGWGHVHHAAFRGFIKSVERFVGASDDQLELETGDELHSTPLLLAVMSGNLETVQCLVNLGAKVHVINSNNHGVVELCAIKQFINILDFFIELNNEKLPVWKNLVRFLASDSDEEAEAAGLCLRTMSKIQENGDINENWSPLFSNGIVPTINKVIKSSISDNAKIQTFYLLLNLLLSPEIREQFTGGGGIASLVRHLKVNTFDVIQLSAECLKELCQFKDYADRAVQDGAIPALVKVMQTVTEPDVLVQVLLALANIASSSDTHKAMIGSTPNAISATVHLFNDCRNKSMLLALTKMVADISDGYHDNQNGLMDEGVANHIISLTAQKNKDIQLNAVQAIHALAKDNKTSQLAIMNEGVVMPLLNLIRKTRTTNLLETTASALWALAGDDIEEKRIMAGMMGVGLLIEFLTSLSQKLHLIGSEGLSVLAQGPASKQAEIAKANGIHQLVRLLKSDQEEIVLSVIRTLRYLCVGVGYVPHIENQNMVSSSRGIKFLVTMMAHSENELIQVEASHTLAAVALGNDDTLAEMKSYEDFSYVRILKMMYSQTAIVRMLSGASLALFSFNSLQNQKDIAEEGGVRFPCFVPFLKCDDEFLRCNSAFQVVVLSRIIPDEEQAISSAAGIKLLVDLLQASMSNDILALAADCVARLAHTRAGIPAAFVSIDCVNLLCDLLTSPGEQVRGNAAIALGYLSYNHEANRQLLNRCRVDPYLMKILQFFSSKNRLSSEFMEGWKHYKQIGLPPAVQGHRPGITNNASELYTRMPGKTTVTSLDDTPASIHTEQVHTDEEKVLLTGRSSRVAGSHREDIMTPDITQDEDTPQEFVESNSTRSTSQQSHLSHISQRPAPPEVRVENA